MGFFNDFIRGATPAIAGGTDIGLRGMAEAQRRKEEAEIQRRNAEQQAFMNLMRQQEMEYGQQRDAIGDQQWQQTFDTNKFFKQQQGVDDLSQIMMQGQNQLQQNNFEQQRLDLAKQQEGRIASGGGGNQQTQAFLAWYNAQPPEIQDEVMRTQAGLSPKAGTIRQPQPVSPLARLSYGTEHATTVMGQRPDLLSSPNSFDSLRNIGMQEYDAAMGQQGGGIDTGQFKTMTDEELDNFIQRNLR